MEKRGKNPNVGGKEWQKHPLAADDSKLQEWLKQGGNYGVIGGWGLVIVDVDSEELKQIAKEKLPETFTVESPGSHGWHLYYLCNLENPIRLQDKGHDNIGDIQGPGKQVVGPGCIHPNGGVYKIVNPTALAQVTPDDLKTAFKDYIVSDDIVNKSIRQAEISRFNIPLTKVVDTSKMYVQGNEYYGAHPIHGSGTGRNFWINPEKNCWHCFRHNVGGGALLWLAVREGYIKCEEARNGLKGSLFRKVLEKAVELRLLKEEEIRVEPTSYFQVNENTGRVSFVPRLLAEQVMGKYAFKTRRDSHEVYVYLHGVYRPHGISYIREECCFELGDKYRRHYADEVVDYIKSSTYAVFMEPPLKYVNVENGILDIKTKTLTPHNPDYIFFNKLPVKYNREATCPKIIKFLDEVTPDKQEKDSLLSFIGYCLYRKYVFSKALLLVGEGANGKSTFLNLVKAFLGAENYSTRSLHELVADRFATSDLFGKLANICADLPGAAIKNTGIFKQLTGLDTLSAQKKFIGAFKFENYAKLMFSTNQPPEPKHDQSFAFFRRWILITFPNVFVGTQADPALRFKLTTEEEFSGLLNRALEALEFLLTNGGFAETSTTNETRQVYMRQANPIQAFVEDCVAEDKEGYVPKKKLYAAYAEYCRIHNMPIFGDTTFYQKLLQVISLQESRRMVSSKKARCFIGITLLRVPDLPDSQQQLFRKSLRVENKAIKKNTKSGKSGTVEGYKNSQKKTGEKTSQNRNGLTCGSCMFFHTPKCPQPKPMLIQRSATYPISCNSYSRSIEIGFQPYCRRCGRPVDPSAEDVKTEIIGARQTYYHVTCPTVLGDVDGEEKE